MPPVKGFDTARYYMDNYPKLLYLFGKLSIFPLFIAKPIFNYRLHKITFIKIIENQCTRCRMICNQWIQKQFSSSIYNPSFYTSCFLKLFPALHYYCISTVLPQSGRSFNLPSRIRILSEQGKSAVPEIRLILPLYFSYF